MTAKSDTFTPQDYLGMGVVAASCLIGATCPVGVYMLLKDASQDVRMVLAGGAVFGTFAIVYRLIESKVQIAKEKTEAYRDAVQIARELYRPMLGPAAPEPGIKFMDKAAEFEKQVWGE